MKHKLVTGCAAGHDLVPKMNENNHPNLVHKTGTNNNHPMMILAIHFWRVLTVYDISPLNVI